MGKKLVSIIIVNWNGKKYVPDCLTSLKKLKYPNIEVLFVDNNSTDGSLEYAKKYYPSMIVIKNSSNLGYAEGHEVALKKAKGDAILLLSTDTLFGPQILDEMVKVLYSSPDIGAVQPKLLLYGLDNKIDSIGMFFTRSGMLYHYGRAKDARLPLYNHEMDIFSAKGACMLFRKEVLQKTGVFDKDFFAYFEETDLCHRIWLSGWRIVYTPKATVIHKGGGSSKQMVASYIYFHSYKNRICSYIKNLSIQNLLPTLFNTFILYEVITVGYLGKGQLSNAFAVQKALFWNIQQLPSTLAKRSYIQSKIRTKGDGEFLPSVTKKVRFSYFYHLFFATLKDYEDQI